VPRERLAYWALPAAMKTIGPPVEGGTRGTWLAERGQFPEDLDPPTYDQRHQVFDRLAGFSENRYLGRYHTDETIPSPYFNVSITDLTAARLRNDLYFTYLHSASDSDYTQMGIGTLIQAMAEENRERRTEGRDEP